MKTAFITGANKGIGLETARQFLQKGYKVLIGSRNKAKGIEAVGKLVSLGFANVEFIQIDVTDTESVERARIALGEKIDALDVLINNSGINGIEFDGDTPIMHTATNTDINKFKEVFEVNVFGAIRVTQALLDLLKKSKDPRIVNVSSSQGSLTLHSDPDFIHYRHKGAVYQSSKAALNMYTVVLAYELRDLPFKVNAVSPGSTKTDFNHQLGQGSVEDAARRIIKYATIGSDGPTGKFFSEDMNPETGEIPW
ncbi:NAD(P)-dependent dehydrogenase (short-subunit alcohol dehydrogenase family) [Flavobacterium gossypii]|uniref:NAD(P)-dependent dehydrogenase (Short-subunit alcohol dehydrogenase family) n=1 Tax=Flavobacterium gossypii TaxID=1646119 RepID=A0ABR6DS22_9FLAO|nr:SDR family oxidoreductase [Flavobacterium gossypii]MBA9074254.1 NAD(P)-dependent dehydrogenase (short-subunit alcohol dehydrogenase family) [Flavobacterium gossypii]